MAFRRKGKRTRKLAKPALRRAVRRIALRAVAAEPKYYTTPITGLLTTAGSLQLVNAFAQGVALGQRVGNMQTDLSLHVRGYVNNVVAQMVMARCIVFYWKQASVPTTASILESASPASAFVLNNKRFYKVLHDRTFAFSRDLNTGAGVTASNSAPRTVNWRIPLRRAKVQYNGTTAADITKNQLYVMWICDTASACNLTSNNQMTYSDD